MEIVMIFIIQISLLVGIKCSICCRIFWYDANSTRFQLHRIETDAIKTITNGK